MMYWQKDIETMSRDELNKLQLERLKQTIELAGHSPFYSKKSLSQRKMTCVIITRLEWQPFPSRIV